jgi:hypothetical protein
MPHVYSDVRKLQGKAKVDGGECVRLVQHYTNVGNTTLWRQGERVLDLNFLVPGTVIANFTKQGRWPGKPKGNHAALFVEFGPRGPDGKPTTIVMMDQWTDSKKAAISARSVPSRGQKLHSEGNIYDDSDNAEHFYVVK